MHVRAIRALRFALGALLLALAFPAPARIRSEAHEFTAIGRTRVLLLGDSNIFGDLGKVLETSLLALGFDVVRDGKPTAGLARPDFYDLEEESRRTVERLRPDVVLILFGGNDGQHLAPRPDSSARSVPWKDEGAWIAEYSYRMRSLAEALRGEDRQVIFLSPTNRRPRIAREKMERIRFAQALGVKDLARVRWIDMFPFSSDGRGRWLRKGLDVFGNPVVFRRADGVHLSPEGGLEVARRLLPTLLELGLVACDDDGGA